MRLYTLYTFYGAESVELIPVYASLHSLHSLHFLRVEMQEYRDVRLCISALSTDGEGVRFAASASRVALDRSSSLHLYTFYTLYRSRIIQKLLLH